MTHKWYVSRQAYWPTGEKVVEIAAGGRQYANPDKLADNEAFKRLGSSREYDDPRQAIEAAFKVRDEWKKTADVRIEIGCTHGFTIPFQERLNERQLRERVAEMWDKILADTPKCQNCGDPIWGDDWWYIPELGEELRFCSEACVDDYYYGTFLDDKAEEQYALA